ncbi:TonB-dependent siderophore receptor [Gloeocapsopsis crepidinum LEGE 06123]|uniref:TonB-dependent siderophore receptor n=2 Tax=Gloeocapsopsis crepidinum TaxID=693223 RepID=A0ABR9UXK8_9CHRO|nr:TonB-dependent siderophore receptor [Gloeocapsopsis crepidinum]MBE9193034.1 TonB-dependent siderophore receptor [Gloeocapsopsis crepidinum LEGE 06123]
MKIQLRRPANLSLPLLIGLWGMSGMAIAIQPAWAEDDILKQVISEQSAAVVQVTVRIEQSDIGLEVILETVGELSQPSTAIADNVLIIDIPNAIVTDRNEFQVANPADGIALVSVTNLPDNRLRVSLTGVDAPPIANIRTETLGLVVSVVSGTEAESEEEIQVIVTGEQDDPYRVRNTTTATRTDTPIVETPQSIQAIPREFIEDQSASDLGDVTRNVAGLNQFSVYQDFALRGFRISDESVLYNGLRGNPYNFFTNSPILSNVERVEVLQGPASVLYGQLQPGGLINIITRQPEADPSTEIRGIAGSYEQFGIQFDSTGSVDTEGQLLYRFNAVHLGADSFRDFQSSDYFQIAPSLTWSINDRTTLALTGEWFDDSRRGQRDRGIVAPGGNLFAVPISFTVNEPDDRAGSNGYAIQLSLNHAFTEDWQLNATGRFARGEYFNRYHNPTNLLDDLQTITRDYRDQKFISNSFAADIYAVGEFATGSLNHRLVIGADTTIQNNTQDGFFADPIEDGGDVPALDIFNPIYGQANPDNYTLLFDRSRDQLRQYGIYLQDQIQFSDRWQALLGLRYDFFDNESNFRGDFGFGESSFSDTALTLRGGVVYEPVDNLFLYTSYSQGFVPQSETQQGPDRGGPFDPEQSWQIEVGAKASVFDNRLTATLATYYIIRENLLVSDPVDFDRLLQIGEARSQGVEVVLVGRITDDWSLSANYAYNDAEVTRDIDSSLVGRQLENAPRHSAALWTRYNFPNTGFGIAGGLRYVDDRPTFNESVQLPSYVVFDAALFYSLRELQLAINFDNIFDTTHFIGGYDETAVSPGQPFTVRFTASYRF